MGLNLHRDTWAGQPCPAAWVSPPAWVSGASRAPVLSGCISDSFLLCACPRGARTLSSQFRDCDIPDTAPGLRGSDWIQAFQMPPSAGDRPSPNSQLSESESYGLGNNCSFRCVHLSLQVDSRQRGGRVM